MNNKGETEHEANIRIRKETRAIIGKEKYWNDPLSWLFQEDLKE